MVKDFNLKENSSTAWLSWEQIVNPSRFEFSKMGFRYGIAGFDAAETTDLAGRVRAVHEGRAMTAYTRKACTGSRRP